MKILSKAELASLKKVSSALGVDPLWLAAMIDLESGWKPTAFNIIQTGVSNPKSKVWDWRQPIPAGWKAFAAGLNQIVPATAASMGIPAAQGLISAYPSVISQLEGPVYKYLVRLKPFHSPLDFYLANFYPAARKNPDMALPSKVAAANTGFKSFRDSGRILEARMKKVSPILKASGFVSEHPIATASGLLVVVGLTAYAAYKWL